MSSFLSNHTLADYFVMTGSLGSFTSPGQPSQNFLPAQNFAMNMNGMERRPNEWMFMPQSGT